MTDNKRILRTRSGFVLICYQLLSGRWASARRKSASRYALGQQRAFRHL